VTSRDEEITFTLVPGTKVNDIALKVQSFLAKTKSRYSVLHFLYFHVEEKSPLA
jgi:hypothetical protein